MTLKAVIFDHSTLFVSGTSLRSELRSLVQGLIERGLKIGVFSTNPIDLPAQLRDYSFPSVDLLLTKSDVGSNKGTKPWMEMAADRLGVAKNEILYVGDEKRDCLTALNSAIFYIQASWTNKPLYDITVLTSPSPKDVLMFVTHFLQPPARWEHAASASQQVYVRSLLGAGTSLAATTPQRFTAYNVLANKDDVVANENLVKIGDQDVVELLGFHVLSSLNNEGLINPLSYFTCYPSSKRGKENYVLREVIEVISKLLHGYYKSDLLVRAEDAPNTSDERREAKQKGREPNISFTTQTNTVHVNPSYRGKLVDRTIFVFDDFTTSGMSLDWARNLLLSAGAAKAVLVTIGKFRNTHEVYTPVTPSLINPFEQKKYAETDFKMTRLQMPSNAASVSLLQNSFKKLVADEPLN